MRRKSLAEIAAEKPYKQFLPWWEVGPHFLAFMSDSIYGEWVKLSGRDLDHRIEKVGTFVASYLEIVYSQPASPNLIGRFIGRDFSTPLYSGEFDALSYAFYRSAFEALAAQADQSLAQERRRFTQRSADAFFLSSWPIFNSLCLPHSQEKPT